MMLAIPSCFEPTWAWFPLDEGDCKSIGPPIQATLLITADPAVTGMLTKWKSLRQGFNDPLKSSGAEPRSLPRLSKESLKKVRRVWGCAWALSTFVRVLLEEQMIPPSPRSTSGYNEIQ